MAVTHHQLSEIAKFEAMTAAIESIGVRPIFTVVALNSRDVWTLIAGKIIRNPPSSYWRPWKFMSPKVRAGTYFLDELGMTEREVVEALLTGGLDTPHGFLAFPSTGRDHGIFCLPFHKMGQEKQQSVHVLQITGDQREAFEVYPDLDWATKLAPFPVKTFRQLLQDWGFDPDCGAIKVDVIELPMATFAETTRVEGKELHIDVFLPHGAEVDDVGLTYQVFHGDEAWTLGGNPTEQLKWTDDGVSQVGQLTLALGSGSKFEGTLSYQGRPQQHLAITDTFSITNAKHILFRSFDTDFKAIQKIIQKDSFIGGKSRELEDVVAWLAWMLGFEPLHIGENKMLQDGPDVIVSAPHGRLAFVEVLSGVDEADRKARKLTSRIVRAKRNLGEAGRKDLDIKGMMVTNRPRDEAIEMFDTARKLGFRVVFREDLQSALALSGRLSHPERLFDRIFGPAKDTNSTSTT